MNTVHPYLFVRPSPGIGLWAMGGYGSGDIEDDAQRRTLGATLRMLSGGVKVPLASRGSFRLGLSGDAFGVRMQTGEGAEAGGGAATRARALLEAAYAAGGLTLATTAGARYDGGDADTGAGAEAGASLGYTGGGLDLALKARAAFGSGGHEEWGAGFRLAWDPGQRGQGLRLALSPGRGADHSGVRALLDHGALGPPHPGDGQLWRLDAETGYGIPSLGNGSLDAYTRFSARGHERVWSAGAAYDIDRSLRLTVESILDNPTAGSQGRGLGMALEIKF